MSFDVHLQPSTTSPSQPDYARFVWSKLEGSGAVREDDVNVRLPDGGTFELYVEGDEPGAMFALRSLSPSFPAALFAVSEETRSFILLGEEALRTPANTGEGPDEFLPIVPITTVTALEERIVASFGGWSDYRAQVARPASETSTLGRLWRRLVGS